MRVLAVAELEGAIERQVEVCWQSAVEGGSRRSLSSRVTRVIRRGVSEGCHGQAAAQRLRRRRLADTASTAS
jgi:hypothetical protein